METFNNVKTWYNEVISQSEPDIIMFLVGNQKDREAKREVPQEKAQQFAKENGIHFCFETSAKTNENVEEVFITAAKFLYHNYKDKIAELVTLCLFIYLEKVNFE